MHSLGAYQQIIVLPEETNAQRRGYLFEQILREALPWDYRPPIAISTKTEQLDGFFEWNSWHFLLEAKAKVHKITAGSHDWEDYALKLRKRNGQCFGLFCSLSEVNEDVVSEAVDLNKHGIVNIIIAGHSWKKLLDHKIQLSEFIKYMVFHAKAKHISIPQSFSEVRNWIYNRELSIKIVKSVATKASSTFMRRHRLIRHDEVYVSRGIDDEINAFARNLRPSRLSRTNKNHKHGNTEFTTKRIGSKQIFIVRDLSGAGKTTLSVQIANDDKTYFGIAKAALQENIDCIIETLLLIGDDYGFKEMLSSDQPFIYVVDSLDEAINTPNKHKELLALLRAVDQLNEIAISNGLLCFPLGLVITVREDFWREWESIFEGTPATTYIKKYSSFTPEQTLEALNKYSSSYKFNLTNQLDMASLRVLSHPFSMQIFAEANEYRGEISINHILDENVLDLYFERKKEDILKRPITGFTTAILMSTLGLLAKRTAIKGKNAVKHDEFCQDIVSVAPCLSEQAEGVVRNIVSEQILVKDTEGVQWYRFRHMRFIEYLVAYYIASYLYRTRNPADLDKLVRELVRGDFLSLFYVHEFIRHICRANYKDLYESITDYYSESTHYIEKLLLLRRAEIASGEKTTSLDIDTIGKATSGGNPGICWEAFFVIAAKNNNQIKEKVLLAFELAWTKNEERFDRWKLIAKIGQHGLLLEEFIFSSVLMSENPMDWYVFIDGIIDNEQIEDFSKVWQEAGGKNLLNFVEKKKGLEWHRIKRIIDDLFIGKIYEKGELTLNMC